MVENGERKSNPFGHGDPHDPPSLREFEANLGIGSREGEEFWRSDFTSVQNLLDYLRRGTESKSTRDEYLRTVDRLCKRAGLDPDELAALETEEAESLVQDFADDMAKGGRTHSYANSILGRLKTFFKSNGYKDFEVDRYYKERRRLPSPHYIPGKQEVHAMADVAGNPRDRSIVYLLWTTGLRVSALLALNYGDIEDELERGEEYVRVDVRPEFKERVPDACKQNIRYYTFVHPIALRSLRSYLRVRKGKYGPLEGEYPLFHSDWNHWDRNERTKRRLDRRSVERVVKRSAKRAGIEVWEDVCPTSLRKAHKSILRSPTVDGDTLPVESQEFLMGHVLPGRLEEYYDKENVEYHRKLYAKLDFQRENTAGDGMDTGGDGMDKVVDTEELSHHLANGWSFLERVDDDKFVVRREKTGKEKEDKDDLRYYLCTDKFMKKQ